ncbi:MAG TPA: GGDEF domain-containing protein [Terriglobales bacterium]|nr:GGDEF domain-containing protein [Terriglobales bacterium]
MMANSVARTISKPSDAPVGGAPVSTAADSILARVSAQLAALEKRDSELWTIVVLSSTLIAAGLLATLAPAVFMNGALHFEITIPKEVYVGLVALIALLNVYLVTRRLEVRRTRQALISTTIQSELLRLQSFTDPLTEVYNRRSLDEMANRYISHARRLEKPLTFAMIDVDRFKEVNTRFGHLTGDMVLAEIAALLRSCVRGSDAVVRFGGDEFLMILADTGVEGAALVAGRVREFLSEWNRTGHLKDFVVDLSIGLAEWQEGKTLDDVLRVADQEMYSAKPDSSATA